MDTNERVGELFNLALGGAGSEASLTSKDEPKTSSISREGDVAQKLLTKHRKLIIEITKLSKEFSNCATFEQFNHCAVKSDDLQMSFCEFRCNLQLVSNPEDLHRLSDRITTLYDKCSIYTIKVNFNFRTNCMKIIVRMKALFNSMIEFLKLQITLVRRLVKQMKDKLS